MKTKSKISLLITLFLSPLFSWANGYEYLKTLHGHQSEVTYVTFDKTSAFVASGDQSGEILIWEVASGQARQQLSGHSGMITDLQFNQDQSLLASASYDGTVRIWDLQNSRLLQVYQNPTIAPYGGVQGNEPTFVRFSPDENSIYFGGYNMKIVEARLQSQQTREVFSGNKYGITCAEITPDKRHLAFGSGGTVSFLNLSSRQIDNAKTLGEHGEYQDWVCEIAFAPHKNILATWTVKGQMSFWNPSSNLLLRSVQAADQQGSSLMSFSKAGQFLLTGNLGSKTRIWSFQNLSVSQELGEHTDAVKTFSFSPDSRYIATGSEDQTVKIWHKPKRQPSPTPPIVQNPPTDEIDQPNRFTQDEEEVPAIEEGTPPINTPPTIVQTPPETDAEIETDEGSPQEDLPELEKIKAIFVLENVHFIRSKTLFLQPEKAQTDLDYLIRIMTKYPNLKIELSGHTDNQGPAYNNLVLSQKRVDRVKSLLVEAGIETGRITAVGYGERRPKFLNDEEKNRQRNRRVEVKVLRY